MADGSHFEQMPGMENVFYMSRGDERMFPEWYAEEPSWRDLYDMLTAAGYPTREDYTFVITGIPDKDSPKTGFSRGWEPGDVLTLSFTRKGDSVEDYFNDTPNNQYAAEEFASYITEFEGITWQEVHELAILDKDYPTDEGFSTTKVGGPNE